MKVAIIGLQVLIVGGLILGAVLLLTLGGDSDAKTSTTAASVPAPRLERFDGNRAWKELLRQVKVGPRPAGSAALQAESERLRAKLPRGRIEPVEGGLRNVVGSLPGRLPAVVISAHYDTKDLPGFVGANDGAGGTATVIEVARSLQQMPRRKSARAVRFVLFDGEEAPQGCSEFLACGVRGSKAYAKAHADELKAVVVVDFVANKGLRLRRDGGSDPDLWARLRAAAKRAGVLKAFPDEEQGEVQDDHTPFVDAGVPAIDLIDFDYAPWHTAGDTPDKLSRRSLDAAGEALVGLMAELRSR